MSPKVLGFEPAAAPFNPITVYSGGTAPSGMGVPSAEEMPADTGLMPPGWAPPEPDFDLGAGAAPPVLTAKFAGLHDGVDLETQQAQFATHTVDLNEDEMGEITAILGRAVARKLTEETQRVLAAVQQAQRPRVQMPARSTRGRLVPSMPGTSPGDDSAGQGPPPEQP